MALKKTDMGGRSERPTAAPSTTKGNGRMRVRMLAQMSGLREGKDWPKPGEEIDVSEDEGKQLIQQGMAEPVDGDDGTDVASQPESATESREGVETAQAETRPRGKGGRK